MTKYQLALEILKEYFPGQYQSQSDSHWSGPFLLHPDVTEHYAVLGPLDLNVRTFGNPCFLPCSTNLWQYQEGYRWDATHKNPCVIGKMNGL